MTRIPLYSSWSERFLPQQMVALSEPSKWEASASTSGFQVHPERNPHRPSPVPNWLYKLHD